MTANELALFLLEVADFLDRHPDIPIPEGPNEITLTYTVNEIADEKIAAMFEEGFDLPEQIAYCGELKSCRMVCLK